MAGRDWLARALREQRAARKLSGVSAAAAAGISQSRISRLESGRYIPTTDEVRALCRVYRTPATLRRQLLQAVEDLRDETAPARVVLLRGAWQLQRRIARIEEGAAQVWVYQPALIPGLLQTEDYMRAVFSDGGDIAGNDLEQAVTARKNRAAVLASGREFTMIIAEGALRWQAVSPAVMLGQLDRLTRAPGNVRLGIVPATRPATVFTTHGFSVYDQRHVIVGTRTGTSFISDPRDVADYVKLFGALDELAVFGAAAAAVISEAARVYRAQA